MKKAEIVRGGFRFGSSRGAASAEILNPPGGFIIVDLVNLRGFKFEPRRRVSAWDIPRNIYHLTPSDLSVLQTR